MEFSIVFYQYSWIKCKIRCLHENRDNNFLFKICDIETISKGEKRKKSEILREILYMGIMEKKSEIALKKVQENKATASKAAKIAGIPLTSFLDVIQRKNINFHYSL